MVQPYFFGDDRQKTTYLYTSGADAQIPWTNFLGKGDSAWHGQHLATVEETNKFRCRLLPGMAAAIATHLPTKGDGSQLSYRRQVEKMARVWHGHGLPLPRHYNALDACPPSGEAREYQPTRGRGTGFRPELVEAPDSLVPPDCNGRRVGCRYAFLPLKEGELERPLPKCFLTAAERCRA